MASTFRASPWVTYQPSDASQVHEPFHQPQDPAGTTMIMDMAMDVDMDAPQISTLREEETPPPTSKKLASPRKPKAPKLKVTEPRIQPRPEPRKVKPAGEEDVEDQAEDEEDQLIDDDDASSVHRNAPSSAALPASGRTPDSTPKKKPAAKRKPKKEKQGSDGSNDFKKSVKEKLASQPSAAGTPEASSQIPVEGSSAQPEPIMLKVSAAAKKKQATSARKATSTPRGRGRGAKSKTALAPHLADDAAMSEAGYTGTAPSSPGTALMDLHDDAGTPEPDNTTIAPSSPPVPPTALAADEPSAPATSLENVAIPQYPLPTKPFPVQAPIKITSGFAPPIPLDKSRKKVRHWRTANREIRGIAGGRWFAQTWVGEKESEYATLLASTDEKAGGPAGGGSISAARISAAVTGKGTGRGKGSKGASAVGSAVPSRAGSAGPEPSASVARPQTKMRILQLAPSENGDSDMAPPES
ncbi:hypothetical protein H1R20_g6467, partial [Candolleomyces eurysporus]